MYANWRICSGALPVLREDDPTPPEHLLQVIWYHQRLLRDQLVLLDGRPLRIFHPGFWNYEAGPDFLRAVLQLGDGEVMSGDVELDLESRGWQAHGHAVNPRYRQVVLHVVWEASGETGLPTLELRGVLDAPLGELAWWLGSEKAGEFPGELFGRCSAPLRDLPAGRLKEVLHQAGLVRFQAKAAQFKSRARQVGWEQSLWEGLFRGLGYKHNVWPMQRVAELRSRLCAGPGELTPQLLQSRLLGVSGLLPFELMRAGAGAEAYLRRTWDYWWRERESFGDCAIPRHLWHFHGLRPANHPERRLALAAQWLMEGKLGRELETWCRSAVGEAELVSSLMEILQGDGGEYWSRHWTLRSARMASPQPMLGRARLTDLGVNVVLPWLWTRATDGRDYLLRRELEKRFLSWPSGQDNTVLRLARERLFGGRDVAGVRGAAAQQGLLQIVRDFCDHSNSICAQCPFPGLVGEWGKVEIRP